MRRPAARRPAALLLLAALLATGPAARACDSSSCSLLTRGDGGLLAPKSWRLDVSFGYTDKGRLLRGSEEVDSVLRPRVFLERGLVFPDFHRDLDGHDQVVQLDAAYGLGRRLNLVASVPLAIWHEHEVSHGAFQQGFGTVGLGDALLTVRRGLGPRGLSGGLAVKFPTGKYRIEGEFGGGIQDPTLQPGTGAFDFVASALYGWSAPGLKLNWSLAGSYQATTTNPLEYRFGNQAIFTAGVARPLSPSVSLSLQAKLFNQERNRFEGLGVPSTGSTVVYLTPGLRFTAANGVSAYAFVLLVPYAHVNEAQLAPRFSVLTGLSKAF